MVAALTAYAGQTPAADGVAKVFTRRVLAYTIPARTARLSPRRRVALCLPVVVACGSAQRTPGCLQ